MYEAAERDKLARELTVAFLGGPWKAERVAESGAGCLDRWPRWMDALAIHVVSIHRTAPADDPHKLFTSISEFLEDHQPSHDEGPPPEILRLRAAPSPQAIYRRRPLEHDWPISDLPSVPALAERLELSDGQLAWLADTRGLERTVGDRKSVV